MKRTLLLTDTKTRKKVPVTTQPGSQVIGYYTCGPTVYAYAHVGNFRTFVAEDLLRRTLLFLGYQVKQVMNLTDVDDKTIKGAIAKECTLDEYTKPFKEAFFLDLKELHIQPAEHYPEATSYIPQMIAMIQTLLDKEAAYVGQDGSVYFRIGCFKQYGELSHLKLDELQAGASERMGTDEYTKDHVADFVLWKVYDEKRDGKIFWESPFGRGRPGWHIECSVMAEALLGKTVDIHAGGVDLIFPHHENEIAQSECCFDAPFCKHWMHVEHLLVDHKKMSKSLGNFYTLRDLLAEGYTGKEVRFMLLTTHYRSQLNFTKSSLPAARAALSRISDFIARLRSVSEESSVLSQKAQMLKEKTMERFTEALSDDLNISEAMASLFDLIREANILYDEKALKKPDADALLSMLQEMNSVLAIMDFQEESIPEDILRLADERLSARKNKDFSRADAIRKELTARGYMIEDASDGCRVKRIL